MSLETQIQNQSERFQNLFDSLSHTQWSESALPEAQAQLAACQNQARVIQEKIDKFNAAAEKEYKRLIDVKGHGVKHVWYKIRGKLEQRVDEQEKIWLKEFEKCKEEEERLTVVNDQIRSAQSYLQQCHQAFEEYTHSKRTLDDLLERYFSGTTPSHPDEDVMEENLKKAKTYLITLQHNYRLFLHVCQLLQKAHQALSSCLHALNDALNMNTFDMFSNSSFADIAVNSYLATARNMSAQAQQFIMEARRVYPNIPHIGNLHVQQDNLIFNLMFDNIFTDMHMRSKIRDSLNRISHAERVLMNVETEMRQRLQQCEIDMNRTRNDVSQLSTEHFNARVNIVKNIIDAPPPYSAI